MVEVEKIRSVVGALGWAKAAYSACLLLLVRHVITFEQFLVLLMLAVGIDFMPLRRPTKTHMTRESRKKSMRSNSDSRSESAGGGV
jgi:hypothetical protein